MPQLPPNHLVIRKALNGERAVFSIAKHPRLYLATDGKGGGSWRLRYRPRPGAAQRWHTISNDARHVDLDAVVKKMTVLVANLTLDGIDPKSQRPRTDRMFADAFALWLDRHAKVHKKSWAADVALYRRHIGSRLGADILRTIDRVRVIAVLDDIARSSTPIQANRCQTVISSVFSWALDEGLITSHPALRIRKRGAETPRDSVMSDQQLTAFWCELETIGEPVATIIKLLLLLGSRLQEIVGIRGSELRLTGEPHWVLPAARSKNGRSHLVPLPPLALDLMTIARERAGDSPFLFPARFVADGPFDHKFVSRRCKRVFRTIGLPDMRLHDLRHQAATGMARCGVPLDIRQLLQNQVTGRSKAIGSIYDQHEYVAEKLRALTLWQDALAAVADRRPWPTERY
jgi:integrase